MLIGRSFDRVARDTGEGSVSGGVERRHSELVSCQNQVRRKWVCGK
jgi:hypothetical protein